MDISVVILTWNSQKYLDRCIRSVEASLRLTELSYEILVMDNGSADRTPVLLDALVQEFQGRLQAEYLPQNLGTTVPRNIALKRAQGDYLCIMDSDVETEPGVFEKLLEPLRLDASLGLVAPKILYPSGLVQKSCDRFPTMLHKAHRLVRLRAMELREHEQLKDAQENRLVDYAISAFWLFPRTVLERVGFLDEKIFYSPEDVDYCLRIWKAGFRILYAPTASVVHHTQEISRGWRLNSAKISHLKGLIYFFIKHRYFLAPPDYKVSRLRSSGGAL